MASKTNKIKTKSGIISLTDKDYKAAGGQGAVFCKGNTAYKIYHDASKAPPVAKINELAVLKRDTILGPTEPIFAASGNKSIGFAMPFIKDTEFLCKVFTKAFRNRNNMTAQNIADLVIQMQETLEYIHSKDILVVDYNEMNFLLSQDLKKVYHIDVDSYQTKSFPAQALMESVRDRMNPKGKFNKGTDWFSFAVVTFQLYIGIHPYKGFHPNYAPADWSKRMDDNISMFDSKVKLPPSVQDFSVIPKKHLDWYRSVFVDKIRSVPPYPGQTMATSGRKVNWKGGGILTITLAHEYKSNIKSVYFYDNDLYVITHEGVFKEDDKVFEFKSFSGNTPVELIDVYGKNPVLAYLKNKTISFYTLDKKHITDMTAENLFTHNGLLYAINNGYLIEGHFEVFGDKHVLVSAPVATLCPSYKIHQGLIVQDDYMKCILAIPYESGYCINISIKELDQHRILDAKAESKSAILMSEKNGSYFRSIIQFNKDYSDYSIKSGGVHSFSSVNFVSLPNGLNVLAEDDKLKLFMDPEKQKEVLTDSISSATRLYHDGMSVYYIEDNKLFRAKM